MRIEVNKDACTGHARCFMAAPEVYEIDDFGYNQIGSGDIAAGLEESARKGAAACPERAIDIR
ncbi:ferredoxin [Rhodococcus sp. JVH1]|uniref:ferredoxin n=1 Tax=Rhodococcus sp. JVH1 TaxID=745408 RepID=UPI000271FE11|nr:ferredoxin [Rhodococcus sp. JVH1]EJI98222.1 ferredoxin 1 [Rhodococcus sp. JVH1]